MDDLIAFIRARLDEDEQAARAAIDQARTNAEWHVSDIGDTVLMWPPEPEVAANLRAHGMHHEAQEADGWQGEQILTERLVPHIARHDPARVLAEVRAKRSILAEYTDGDCDIALPHVLAIAAIYADHPDYREEWRP